jgi:hypothetical protein
MGLHYRNLNRQLEPRAIPYLSVLPQPPEMRPQEAIVHSASPGCSLEHLRPLAWRKLVDPQNEYFNAN